MAASALAWLDLNEEGRRMMQEHLALLHEPETLDELGIGQIRDTFADMFFPGTSTLWRRARYMLFVPWVYRSLELDGTGGVPGEVAARRKQVALSRALKNHGDTNGLIGLRADEPRRLPDELVWNGLSVWGVRVRAGSIRRHQRAISSAQRAEFRVRRGDEGELLEAESGSWWHGLLPPEPEDLLAKVSFSLTSVESEFLAGRLTESQGESMLARMLEAPALAAKEDLPWDEVEAIERLQPELREAMRLAQVFSAGAQGAGLLYSYFVARAKGTDNAAELADRFVAWSSDMTDEGSMGRIRRWPRLREPFRSIVGSRHRGIRPATYDFVDRWMDLAKGSPKQLLKSARAFELIKTRERATKKSLARLSSDKALQRARAEAGTYRLTFRWLQTSQIVNDIVGGLRGTGH